MRRVYLIRHGTTAANERSLYYGATDIGLSEKGRTELLELSRKGGYPDVKECSVFTSGMMRTAETLEILFPHTKFQIEPDFREMDFGKFEMRSYEDLKDDPEYQTWITGDFMANACPQGESGNAQCERAVRAFWDVYKKTKGDVLIVSHSGTIIGIMQSLFPNEGENRWYWQCNGGCGYAVELEDEKAVSYYKIPKI
ncbi:MAG: histidine phosphatase family protein [Oscillospiraceae bacterium]|nr:histidine phosphatase family protein [Oscillospiraceae bacterium]